jgi:glycogen operon protein
MINAYWEALEFELPMLDAQEFWQRRVDTSLDPLDDIRRWADAPVLHGSAYRIEARSVVLLLAKT